MITLNADLVNNNYGNVLNVCNPIFKDIISRLISTGLYTSAIAPGSPSRLPGEGSIQICKNGTNTPLMAVPLEAIVDCISRAIISGYLKGFEQNGLKSDGATNIGFTLSDKDPKPFTNISLGAAENVHDAIVSLGIELNAVKASLAQPPLPFTKNTSVNIPNNV